MNWPLLFGLTLAIVIAAIIRLRVEPRRARLANWLFIYPGALVLFLYAWFGSKWFEVLGALVAAAVIVGGWWIAYGSYLPTPNSNSISVWGQEAKKPAEAQAEVERLKKEKEALEKELRDLREKKEMEEK
jgi:hypothetical protein